MYMEHSGGVKSASSRVGQVIHFSKPSKAYFVGVVNPRPDWRLSQRSICKFEVVSLRLYDPEGILITFKKLHGLVHAHGRHEAAGLTISNSGGRLPVFW